MSSRRKIDIQALAKEVFSDDMATSGFLVRIGKQWYKFLSDSVMMRFGLVTDRFRNIDLFNMSNVHSFCYI